MSNTTYDEIIDLILVSIEDYHLNKLAVASINDFKTVLEGYMIRGLVKFENCQKDLSDRNDSTRTFNIYLTDIEKGIIADCAVIVWLDKQINDVRQITGMLENNKESHRFSEANNLNAKINRKNQLEEEVNVKKTNYSYKNSSWLNKKV